MAVRYGFCQLLKPTDLGLRSSLEEAALLGTRSFVADIIDAFPNAPINQMIIATGYSVADRDWCIFRIEGADLTLITNDPRVTCFPAVAWAATLNNAQANNCNTVLVSKGLTTRASQGEMVGDLVIAIIQELDSRYPARVLQDIWGS